MIPHPDPHRSPEEVLAAFLEAHPEPSPEEIEALCAEHADHAADLRRLLAAADDLQGMLAGQRELEAGFAPTAGETRSLHRASRFTRAFATSAFRAGEGETVGDFRLVRLIGRGGMGEVWEAEQLSLSRPVALKLLLPERVDQRGLDFFAREARAGGRLSNPGIVSVFGTGEDEGLHWIAMELVPEACDLRHSLEGLREEGELPESYYNQVAEFMAGVADALEVAHTGGVIHRDLKPGNILVASDDRPKVSDFGLAKLTDEHSISLAGQLVGTFAYMSPEQVAVKHAGIDHRTDIFSLGVVMYEMLTLVRAFEGDTTEQVAQKILWEDPVDPRVLRSRVPQDLAVICVKAMAKAPGRRYLSMTELAADLRRHLGHEPIHARPPTAMQRMSKWVRRNPTKSAVVAVAVAALVIITGLWWRAVEAEAATESALAEVSQQRDLANSQRDRAREAEADTRSALAELGVQKAEVETQRDRADQNATLAKERAEEAELRAADLDQVVKFHEEQLSGIDAQAMGLTIQAMVLERTRVAGERAGREPEVLERERADLEKLLAGADFTTLALGVLDKEVFQGALRELEKLEGQRLIQARLQDVIGKVYRSLAMYAQAEPVLEKALATRRELLGNADQSTLDSMATLGLLRVDQARYREAIELYEEALARSRAAEGGTPALSFQSRMLACLGLVAARSERFDLAEQASLEAMELAEAAGDEHRAATARSVLGVVYWKMQRHQEADPILREQLDYLRRSQGEDDPETLAVLNNLALNYRGLGRSDEAVPIYEELIERHTRIHGADHPRTVTVLNNLAYVHQKQGRFDKAEPLFLLCLELTEARFGKDHESSQFYAMQVANLYYDSGRFEAAESRYKGMNEQTLRMLGRENGAALQNLCLLYRSWGRLPEALAFGQRSLDYHREIRGDDHMRTIEALKELGLTQAVAGQLVEARVHLLEALQTSARLRAANHRETQGVLSTINEVVWPLVDPDGDAGTVPHDSALIALQLITAAVEVAATDPAMRDTRAWALLAAERYDEGLAESEKALELAAERDKQVYQGYVERMRAMVDTARAIDSPARDEADDR
ncbi:MAG: hypothetical protein CMJ84_17150 [Planctomycetes bacterium]|nr:hypothetical protein [Planctomycetota bacterium]